MTAEATFNAGIVVGPRWSVSVPVPDGEQRHDHASGNPYLFLTTRLAIYPDTYTQGDIGYTLSGPNIRQDGTPGARTLSRRVQRAEVAENYPLALEVAKMMLAGGAKQVLTNANMTAEAITHAISG